MKLFLKITGGLLATIIGFFVISIYFSGNFYQLDKNAYRSGQLYFHNLPYYLKRYNIKTVINLTQGGVNSPEYLNEIEITKNLGIGLVNYKMFSGDYLNVQKTTELVNILKTAEKPILIHCLGGADRTSLVAALYGYEIMGQTVKVAKQQFSLKYGHTPKYRPKVIAMDKSFEDYVAYKKLP